MTRNIFGEKISCWSNINRSSANNITITIQQFLHAGQAYLHRPNDPTDISRLRELYDTALQVCGTDPTKATELFKQYKQQKTLMPLATMGGTFAGGGMLSDLLQSSNVLCVDIDSVKPTELQRYDGQKIPNSRVKDWDSIKWQLAQLPFVAYAALSIGGHGLFLLIPIEDSSLYTHYWKTLEHLFGKHLNLTIDPNTKDITRPRFISYDPEPYINTEAEVFTAVMPQARPTLSPRLHSTTPCNSTEEAVRKCVEEIERKSLDITANYCDWIDIASALHNGLGEAGKSYFQRVSRFYPEASYKEIENKWDDNKGRSRIGIGTFFHICEYYGIRFKETAQPPTPPPPVVQRQQVHHQRESATAEASPKVYCRFAPLPSYSMLEDITQEQFDDIFSTEAVRRFWH